MNQQLYLLKIQLLYVEPAIWRQFVVPANITLDRLHDVVQLVMGWTDSHLHAFTIAKKSYMLDPESGGHGLDSSKYHLGDLVSKKDTTFSYQYDFGCSWEHVLVLEDANYINKNLSAEIVCLDGERACPPEDIGGPPVYYEFCQALKDPDNEENQELLEYYDNDFDPEQFDCHAVNADLVKYIRWSRNSHQD